MPVFGVSTPALPDSYAAGCLADVVSACGGIRDQIDALDIRKRTMPRGNLLLCDDRRLPWLMATAL